MSWPFYRSLQLQFGWNVSQYRSFYFIPSRGAPSLHFFIALFYGIEWKQAVSHYSACADLLQRWREEVKQTRAQLWSPARGFLWTRYELMGLFGEKKAYKGFSKIPQRKKDVQFLGKAEQPWNSALNFVRPKSLIEISK